MVINASSSGNDVLNACFLCIGKSSFLIGIKFPAHSVQELLTLSTLARLDLVNSFHAN